MNGEKKIRILLPLTGRSREELLWQAEHMSMLPGFSEVFAVEFRYDLAQGLRKEEINAFLAELRERLLNKPLLFTIRTDTQGGAFPYEAEEYEEVNRLAIRSGQVSLLDLELRREGYGMGRPGREDREITERLILLCRKAGIRTIASYHDFRGTPGMEELLSLFQELSESGADILKAAFMPEREADVLRLMYATRLFRDRDSAPHEYISMSMGELGRLSRAAGSITGSDYSFASAGSCSAPGQLPLSEMQELLRILS